MVEMVWWQFLLLAVGLLASAIIARGALRDRPIISKSRATLRADLEILKLLESTDQNYQIIKANVDASILSIYGTRKKRLRVYDWYYLIIYIPFFCGFTWWTVYLANGGSSWAVLTGFFAFVGLIGITKAFDEPRASKSNVDYETAKHKMQLAVTSYQTNHNGELPLTGATVAIEGTDYDIIDVCALVVKDKLLRKVPKGTNKRNCSAGGCTCQDGHYLWLCDRNGNVLSTCVGAECKANNEDGYQGVWP